MLNHFFFLFSYSLLFLLATSSSLSTLISSGKRAFGVQKNMSGAMLSSRVIRDSGSHLNMRMSKSIQFSDEFLKYGFYIIFTISSCQFLYFFSKLSSRIFKEIRPLVNSRISNQLTDKLELMGLRISLEQGLSLPDKLGNDAPDRPYIN